jgi:hypothetical protein
MNEFLDQLFFGGYFKHVAEMEKAWATLQTILYFLVFFIGLGVGMELQKFIARFDRKRAGKEEKTKDSDSYRKRVKLT